VLTHFRYFQDEFARDAPTGNLPAYKDEWVRVPALYRTNHVRCDPPKQDQNLRNEERPRSHIARNGVLHALASRQPQGWRVFVNCFVPEDGSPKAMEVSQDLLLRFRDPPSEVIAASFVVN
jgi:hypothetical protein